MKFGLTFISTILLSAVALAVPRAEYPRPQFERADWVNLNGEWSYTLDPVKTGWERGLKDSRGFDGKITVPFAPESDLSGRGLQGFHQQRVVPAHDTHPRGVGRQAREAQFRRRLL